MGSFFIFALTVLGLKRLLPLLTDLLVIMIICVTAQMLSSSVEYLSACLYNSSLVADGSKDSEWNKGVDGSKLLLKF